VSRGLGRALDGVQAAVSSLKQTSAATSSWSDNQRSQFDEQRMKPLLDAGQLLDKSLTRADQRVADALRALDGHP
jgi:hypothetical protein